METNIHKLQTNIFFDDIMNIEEMIVLYVHIYIMDAINKLKINIKKVKS